MMVYDRVTESLGHGTEPTVTVLHAQVNVKAILGQRRGQHSAIVGKQVTTIGFDRNILTHKTIIHCLPVVAHGRKHRLHGLAQNVQRHQADQAENDLKTFYRILNLTFHP